MEPTTEKRAVNKPHYKALWENQIKLTRHWKMLALVASAMWVITIITVLI